MVAGEAPGRPAAASVAIVDGQAIAREDLWPALLEIGGVEALTEIILDRRLEAEAERAGIVVSEVEVAREENLLRTSLSSDPDTATRLLESLRRNRGLGPGRYQALVRRNALLRVLVAGEVVISEEAIAAHYDFLHGEKRQARIITVPNLAAAIEVARRSAGGGNFSDLAVELSTDASASRGGLLEPISRSDPSYPEALRTALWRLQAGETSAPVMLDGSLAILKLERTIPASGAALEPMRAEIEELARRNQERMLMEELARRLVQEAGITVLDAELDRQWNMRAQD